MKSTLESVCARCQRPHAEHELACPLCGNVFRREERLLVSTAAPSTPATTPLGARPLEHDADERDTRRARLDSWLYLGLGLVTAPVFAWTPLLQRMGWFLESLVHEMGHAAAAWLCGMPSIPAISLTCEAASVHGPQSRAFALLIALGFGLWIGRATAGRTRVLALGALTLVYPLIAFTGVRELLHLLAGHLAELAFAGLCFWKTLDGGFTDSRLERALHGTLAWFLLGRNASLCWGLMNSPAARGEYRSNGSFGLTNDYIRVAEELLSWRLESVALAMLVLAALVLPAVFFLRSLVRRT